MSAVAIVDTSILCELLGIPGKSQDSEQVKRELKEKSQAGERLFLPLAVVFETGNHIGHLRDGDQRRRHAETLVKLVIDALEGRSPFVPMQVPNQSHLKEWLGEFSTWVTRGQSGLVDLSLKHDWDRLCGLNPGRRVYVWSKEKHLAAYDRPAEI